MILTSRDSPSLEEEGGRGGGGGFLASVRGSGFPIDFLFSVALYRLVFLTNPDGSSSGHYAESFDFYRLRFD